MAVQPIDEIDLNLRVKEAGLGEPFDQLLAKHGDVNRSGGDNTDLGAILGLVDLILRNVGVLSERRPENERVDMSQDRCSGLSRLLGRLQNHQGLSLGFRTRLRPMDGSLRQ